MPNSQLAIQAIPTEVLKLAHELDLFTVPGTAYPEYDEYLVDEVGGYANIGKLYYVKVYHSGHTRCECNGASPCVHAASGLLFQKREATSTESLDAFITRLDLFTCSVLVCYNPATKSGAECHTRLAELAAYSDPFLDQAAPQQPPTAPITALPPAIQTELHHPPWSFTLPENLSPSQLSASILAPPKSNP
jgi:hypothetical protein